MFETVALELGIPAIGAGAATLGALAFFRVPVIGKYIAIGMGALAAGAFVYGAGFNERGKLDHSADLAAQVVQMKANAAEAQRQADAAKTIAVAASARQQSAEDEAAKTQEKVEAYAAALAKRKTPPCALSPADAASLRDISGARPNPAAKPAASPSRVRPASSRARSP
jgi:hypothetical protein